MKVCCEPALLTKDGATPPNFYVKMDGNISARVETSNCILCRTVGKPLTSEELRTLETTLTEQPVIVFGTLFTNNYRDFHISEGFIAGVRLPA